MNAVRNSSATYFFLGVPAMTSVGSMDVKNRLPQLLERVSRGEKILITRNGKPVAMLVPAPADNTSPTCGM